MLNNRMRLAWGIGLVLFSSYSFAALTPGRKIIEANDFLFIENNIDNEYYISPLKTNPRFSGANVWTKYGKQSQDSLGYMGEDSIDALSNSYNDMWIENPIASNPFLGLRCRTINAGCPSKGYFTPELVDEKGFYKAKNSGGAVAAGGKGYGTLSMASYQAYRELPVGQSHTSQINFCSTEQEYDPARGERCATTATKGKWSQADITHTKIGHISLHDTHGASEIWVASDGTPFLIEKPLFCEHSFVKRDAGITCKMLRYDYKKTSDPNTGLKFGMVINTTALNFKPGGSDVLFSGTNNGSDWVKHTSHEHVKDFFQPGTNYVYVFLSQAFFKNLIVHKGSIDNQDDIFTFDFDNSNTPQSGFYQFSTSTKIKVIPREYGVSIRPEEDSKGLKSGIIGSGKSIDFNYLVTLSSPKMAQTVTAQVRGSVLNKNGQNFCTFQPPDKSYDVLIPAYLSYTKANGSFEKIRNSCGDMPIKITNATWTVLPWASQQSGYFFSTPLKLSFPMHENISRLTGAGQNWEGTVYAEGDVKVTAEWIGIP